MLWPVNQRVNTDAGRFLVEKNGMDSRRQNCKRLDRQKIWSEASTPRHTDRPIVAYQVPSTLSWPLKG